MNCNEASKIDIVKFLARNSIIPDYSKGVNIWYKSPLRKEEKPSFKVNSDKNLWFDFGLGDGGDVIKLVCLLFDINHTNALKLLSRDYAPHIKAFNIESPKVIISSVKEISSIPLINYMKFRKLNMEFVYQFCKEASFKLNEKNYYAVGFENDSKGFELRCKYFKGSSTPKDITLIKNNADKLLVFEGFIDFLSWFSCSLFFSGQHDYLILNTLSFLNKSKLIIKNYKDVLLFLDNDDSGKRATSEILALGLSSCSDMSKEYSEYKDLNDFLMKSN